MSILESTNGLRALIRANGSGIINQRSGQSKSLIAFLIAEKESSLAKPTLSVSRFELIKRSWEIIAAPVYPSEQAQAK